MNTVGLRIRKLREEKNISQEKMAMELIITQSNYGRLEKDDKRLTVPKLRKISEVLDVNVSYLFAEDFSKRRNQIDNRDVEAYNFTVFQSDKDHIKTLKDEIAFLRKLLEVDKKMKKSNETY
ncbi:helix-turn-helix domain-containing protein [Flavobacterium amniphilum]|uniref:helix-turn-helix domain-containing protein n=1 Tax=Flavobacterium amniphilum TaxID=1834035 RepID=UPI002029ED94|nr:helix-turn-helix transcriptional regulator [Flavobacterium amniphilum]MCL9804903.1 helix-turn-helix domain-containing protein [Flavobacterium amniphilum]